MFGIRDLKAFDSDYNLLWASSGYEGCLVSVERKWPRGFEAYRTLSGLDKNSVHAPPAFIHAPAYVQAMDYKRATKMTRSKFYTWGKRGDFAVGDRCQVDFDGPMRTVIEVGEDYVVVDPPLAKLPVKAGLIGKTLKTASSTCGYGPTVLRAALAKAAAILDHQLTCELISGATSTAKECAICLTWNEMFLQSLGSNVRHT